ncbi:MAG TPA: hypothetical protein VKS01_08025 [Bryobacteraceae bacterium]|nr:hypothetical protein [Bryobacteraceae bacterium]
MIHLPKSAAQRTAFALLGSLWMVCVFRAATQSIVHDEALTYQFYLTGPAGRMFQLFDANHHFLNTLLMRASTSLFGFSSLAMRLPALLGAAIFFAALYRFCGWALGPSWRMTLAVAAVALNPLVLDLMVAARGYGLALALWMMALALLAPRLEAATPYHRRSIALAGTCAALSVTANLVFVPPVAMLAAIVAWFSLQPNRRPPPARRGKPYAKPPRLWFDFFIPAIAIAILFLLASPLENASKSNFYAGASSIAQSLRSLAEASLIHSGPSAYVSFTAKLVNSIAFVFPPLAIAAGAVAAIRWRNLALALLTVSAGGAALLLLATHLAFDFPYPADRTGLYFLPALTLIVAALCAIPQRAIQSASAAILLLMVAGFALQFDPRFFFTWRYDADTDKIAARFAEFARLNPSARFALSWELEPSLNFYRETRHWNQLPRFVRQPMTAGRDAYAIILEDDGIVRELGLRIVYQGPVSGTVIGVLAIH